MKGPGAHFHIQGLQDHAALPGPKVLQCADEALKGIQVGSGHGAVSCWRAGDYIGRPSRVTRVDAQPCGCLAGQRWYARGLYLTSVEECP